MMVLQRYKCRTAISFRFVSSSIAVGTRIAIFNVISCKWLFRSDLCVINIEIGEMIWTQGDALALAGVPQTLVRQKSHVMVMGYWLLVARNKSKCRHNYFKCEKMARCIVYSTVSTVHCIVHVFMFFDKYVRTKCHKFGDSTEIYQRHASNGIVCVYKNNCFWKCVVRAAQLHCQSNCN